MVVEQPSNLRPHTATLNEFDITTQLNSGLLCKHTGTLMIAQKADMVVNITCFLSCSAETPSSMLVSWVTFGPTSGSLVKYGLKGKSLTSTASGNMTKFVDSSVVRYMHVVNVKGLQPGAAYGMLHSTVKTPRQLNSLMIMNLRQHVCHLWHCILSWLIQHYTHIHAMHNLAYRVLSRMHFLRGGGGGCSAQMCIPPRGLGSCPPRDFRPSEIDPDAT